MTILNKIGKKVLRGNKMQRKINSKKTIEILIKLSIVLVILTIVYFFFNKSKIILVSSADIEINSIVDYSTFVKSIKDDDIENVTIDASAVNISKLGEYNVVYQYQDEEKILKVNVVDTIAPQVTTQTKTIAMLQDVKPQEFIKTIKDETKTTVEFKKKYAFEKAGKQEIELIVKDEGKNETIKKVIVNVVKDEKAPVIITDVLDIKVDSEVDLNTLIKVRDDFDKKPVLKIDDRQVRMNQLGTYSLDVTAQDFSGNQTQKTIQVNVKKTMNEKVVYLTFDDGPSKFTSKVLDILKKYDCQATFFVTGMNANYRPYIKQAYMQGHTIGLHTYSHKYNKLYASTDAYFNDLNKIGQLVESYIGFVPQYIRFPGGGSNTVSKKYSKGIMTKLTQMVEAKGYRYYDWNAENGDGYSKMSQAEMLRRATASKQNEIMILMHDANGKQNTVDILPKVIEYYQKRGYAFKAIDDYSFMPHQRVNN